MSHVCTLMIEKVKCPCCSFLDTRNLNFLNLSLESALLYVYIYIHFAQPLEISQISTLCTFLLKTLL